MPQRFTDAERQRLPELLPARRVLPDRDALLADVPAAHGAGGLSERDVRLARAVGALG